MEYDRNSPAAIAAQGQLEAYNNRSIDDFCRWYADDIQLIEFETGEVFCTGKDAMRERYAPMFEKYTSLYCKLVNRIVCGNFAFDEEKVSGIHTEHIIHAVATYEVSGGLIRRAWFVRDKSS